NMTESVSIKDDPFVAPLLNNPHLDRLGEGLRPLRARMTRHPLFDAVGDMKSLRLFMERHVFAVYDFMSLLTALQQRLTCVTPPWRPVSEKLIRRFVNHMVLEEETDEDMGGGYASHLEMYLAAMEEVGADTDPMNRLLYALERGSDFHTALASCGAPAEAAAFNKATFSFIETGDVHRIAAAFTFGREDPIPDMFRAIIATLAKEEAPHPKRLQYYLDRHVHLDEDFHNPMARLLVARLCVENPKLWAEAEESAKKAVEARIALWDGTLKTIQSA
ncbi:MAG: DUF3050 domain-containing protein, partial [Nitrospinae bacterium]|nr:DUF3050 domain-containing protein [Nitrospinota bacterium]